MERTRRNAPALLLGAVLLAAAAMTLILARDLTFLQDTWEFLMNRRDPNVAALLHPHNEHLVLFPVLIEEGLLRLFGMSTATPEYLVMSVFLLATAALLYVYVKRRVGPWAALLATIVILFLGPAWEVLLWPFEITFVGPVLFGLATLLALERDDAPGDLLACVCLIAALGFSGLGVPFFVAAVVAIAVGRRERWLARAYVVGVPGVLFVAWYLRWGHEAHTHISTHNLLNSPRVVAEAASVATGSLSGWRQLRSAARSPQNGVRSSFWR